MTMTDDNIKVKKEVKIPQWFIYEMEWAVKEGKTEQEYLWECIRKGYRLVY